MANTARTTAAKRSAKKASGPTPKRKTPSKKSTAAPAPRQRSSGAKTIVEQSGEDWQAAKEILTAHRTLARAERRENTLAEALKTHAATAKDLKAELKKVQKQLRRADEELASSAKARTKAAQRLRDVERREAKGRKTQK